MSITEEELLKSECVNCGAFHTVQNRFDPSIYFRIL
jgi:hypothetical protein